MQRVRASIRASTQQRRRRTRRWPGRPATGTGRPCNFRLASGTIDEPPSGKQGWSARGVSKEQRTQLTAEDRKEREHFLCLPLARPRTSSPSAAQAASRTTALSDIFSLDVKGSPRRTRGGRPTALLESSSRQRRLGPASDLPCTARTATAKSGRLRRRAKRSNHPINDRLLVGGGRIEMPGRGFWRTNLLSMESAAVGRKERAARVERGAGAEGPCSANVDNQGVTAHSNLSPMCDAQGVS